MGSILGSPLPPSPPPPPYQPPPQEGGSGWKFLLLAVAVLGLVGGCIYLYMQIGQVRQELADTRDALQEQIARTQETSNVSSQTSKRNVDLLQQNLKKELDQARQQASQLAGQAKVDATKHADELASQLQKSQEQQAKQVTAVTADLSQVKDQAVATQGKVGEVSTEVGTLRSDQAATRQELEKTIADLRSAKGDLGVQSGLIATNAKELGALKALGERNYTEFKLAKEKKPTKVGDVQIQLKSADTKRNKYTITLIADDKTVEKKDKSINEPLQFYLSRAAQPYELVVNEVRKDLIVGYVSAPKVQQTRKAAAN